MKHIITIMAGLALATTASAIDLKTGTAYRIVSHSYPDATICVGNQHYQQPYLFSNLNYNGTCKDAYWYFQKQKDGSYAIYNADTKEYITYTTERINGTCKGLKLTAKDEGATSHWFIEEQYGGYMLYTKAEEAEAKGDTYWNQRVNASDNYLLGTYSYGSGNNSIFDITTEGYVKPDPGPDPGPGPDVPDPQPEVKPSYTVIDGGADVYVVGQSSNRLTLLPKDYIASYTIDENTVTFTIADDYKDALSAEEQTIVFTDVNYLDENALPADVEFPSFTSYKFNNKFNYQVLSDVEAADPTADAFTIPVSGIGKWLTASFQLSDKAAAVYLGDVLQESKVTRQRFDKPMTYTVGYKTWRQLELRDYAAADAATTDIRTAYVPFGRQQTVTVDWLCDKSTTQYGVPRIDITLTDHPNAEWGSGGWGGGWGWDEPEYYWLGQDGKTTYVPAEITIDGGGAFPSMDATPILIKGRGNSTWSQSSSSKNPYHFKFDKGQKPLGMTKGKHWVLLCNKQSGSMTTNAIGHRVAEMMGGVAPCHVIPVDLYINDSYRGSYNLCEKVGFGNNCIALDDETNAAMVELDTYTDEKIYYDYAYYIKTKMKEPDFDDEYEGPLSSDLILEDWNNLLSKAYYNEDIAPYVDVDRLAAYLAANEAIANCELKHAKSCFAYSENVLDGFSIEASADETPWVFGPLWDCDWAFGYEQQKSYFEASAQSGYFTTLIDGGDSGGQAKKMWNALLKNPEVNKAYYYKWYDYVNNRLPELIDFCKEYYDFARRSLEHNNDAPISNYDYQDYAKLTTSAQAWLKKRGEYVLSHIKTTYPLPEVPVEPEPTYEAYSGQIFGSLGDGGVVGIHSAIADNQSSNGQSSNSQSYDLQGRRMTTNSQGVSVTRARKTIK